MKKILLFCLMALTLVGCSKDDEEATAQTFFVNAYYTYSDYPDYGNRIADNTFVGLYEDNGNDIGSVKTTSLSIYDTNENELSLKYTSSSSNGINTFEGIPNGNYVLLVVHYPYTYTRYYSYKKITVNKSYNYTTEKIVFDCSKSSGYQIWQ